MTDTIRPSRRNVLTLLGSAAAGSLLPAAASASTVPPLPVPNDIHYTVAADPWPTLLGNHRVHVWVERPADAVHVHIPWRRVDLHPETKAILLFDPQGIAVKNIATGTIAMESGEFVFEAKSAGTYLLYYLPHAAQRSAKEGVGPKGQYLAPKPEADAAWSRRNATPASWGRLPSARVVEFQARTALDSFYPMEVAATKAEVDTLNSSSQPILLFLESRENPIQMTDMLPRHWARQNTQAAFSATALRGEFYVFQIGVYGNPTQLKAETPISLRFDNLAGEAGVAIPATAFQCINTGGVDPRGVAFQKQIRIKPGEIRPLWCAVQVPLDAKPGKYTGAVHVILTSGSEQQAHINLEVHRDFIRDGGVDQPWRVSRIKWLNSTIGAEGALTAPYTALQAHGRTISCLGREVTFGDDGLPQSIRANGIEILAAPVGIRLPTAAKWTSTGSVESSGPAKAVLVSESHSDGFDLHIHTTMEFDGGMGFEVKLTSRSTQAISNIALEIPYRKEVAPYAVGMELPGGKRPAKWAWKWATQPARWKEQGSNLEFFCWMGSVQAGLFCRLKSPLDDWKNDGSGTVSIDETGNTVWLRASTGRRTMKAGEEVNLSFRLLPTPVKPMDPGHWNERYVQAYLPPEELHKLEASVINLHQGTEPNLYINYPFLNLDLLAPYISSAHALDMKVKLYYTMRELTTRLPELWAFRSLGDEIYRVGGTQGQGDPQLDFWLQEHLRDNYSPGWIQKLPEGGADTSLRIYSNSRLANFYLEGLKWLLDNVHIDGLYLDEIGYSRETMQRVRRVLQRRPGAMIDMHGNHVWWSCNCPIGYYMEHLPYIDRLWLGESFNSDGPPEYWLIEMSGIPFGLSSDMLQRPNPWRGMLFGMTDRALWSHAPSPTPIWQLWRSFGIHDAAMSGWWEPDCPVTTGRDDMLATVYRKPDKSLIAIASWATQTVDVKLHIDWKSLGLNPNHVTITAPAMEGFQPAAHYTVSQSIPVPAGKGFLLLVEPHPA